MNSPLDKNKGSLLYEEIIPEKKKLLKIINIIVIIFINIFFIMIYLIPIVCLYLNLHNFFYNFGKDNYLNKNHYWLLFLWTFSAIIILINFPGSKKLQIYSKGITSIKPSYFSFSKKYDFLKFKCIESLEITELFGLMGSKVVNGFIKNKKVLIISVARLGEFEFERSLKILIKAYKNENINGKIIFNESFPPFFSEKV